MQKISIIQPGEELTYDDYTDRLYNELLTAYWKGLPDFSNYTEATKAILDDYREFLSPLPSEEILEAVKDIADMFSITWNKKQFLKYTKAIEEDKALTSEDGEVNIELMALCNVIKWIIPDMEQAYQGLKEGKYRKIGDYLFVDGMINTVIGYNEGKMEMFRSINRNSLTKVFKELIGSPSLIDKELFYNTEYAEFSRFFKQGESIKGWGYFKKRLECTDAEIEKIYSYSNDIVLGTYTDYYLQKNNDTALHYIGKLFAIKDYLSELRSIYDEIKLGKAEANVNRNLDLKEAGSNKISLLATHEQTENYFMELSHKKPGYDKILSEEDVRYWLGADFKGFNGDGTDKPIKLNGDTRTFAKIRYYVHQYWLYYGGPKIDGSREAICRMLLNRFDRTAEYESIRSSLSVSVKLPDYLLNMIAKAKK